MTSDLPLFQRVAPFSEPGTSLEAARAIEPHLERLEAVVLDAIRTGGGLCDHEVEAVTGLRHQTASARRRALVLRGLVRDSGRTRRTDSGRRAIVWEAT